MSWTTYITEGCSSGSQPYWVTYDNGHIRAIIVDSTTCPGGTCNSTQSGYATQTITVSCLSRIDYRIYGKIEAQDPGFEFGGIYCDDELMDNIISTDAGQGCNMVGKEASGYFTIEAGSHIIKVEFDTVDPLWHQGSYIDFTFSISDTASSSSSSSSSFSTSLSSSSTSLSTSSSTSSIEIYNNYGITYYSDFKDVNSINNPKIDNNVKMKFVGHFEKDFNGFNFDKMGYGIKRTKNGTGVIYCNDASRLFSISKGYLGVIVSFPEEITDGIYYPLIGDNSKLNEYVLWGVNICGHNICQPGLYAALTPRGIEFTIFTSAGHHTIVDNVSDIEPNEDVLIEFLWNSDILDDYLVRSLIRVNGVDVATGNGIINNDSIENLNFYLLNTPDLLSNYECSIKRLSTYNKIPDEFIIEWWSSSSSDSITSISSSVSSQSVSSDISSLTSSQSRSNSSFSSESDIYSSDSYSSNSSKSESSTSDLDPIWTLRSGTYDWNGVDVSYASGQYMAAVVNTTSYGGIYVSSDFGVNWSRNLNKSWYYFNGISVSSTGQNMIACGFGNYLYRSTNYGVTWTQFDARYWLAVKMSSSGTYIVAVENGGSGGYAYLSSSGVAGTYSQISSIGFVDWSYYTRISISSSGSIICIFNPNERNKLWISSNSGSSFTKRTSPSSLNIVSMCVTGDGSKINVIVDEDFGVTALYLSTNYGVSWSKFSWQYGIFYNGYSLDMASSNDGKLKLSLSYTNDYGSSWIATPATVDYRYFNCGISSDGTRMAIISGTNIWTGVAHT